jgi:hypothetical protein
MAGLNAAGGAVGAALERGVVGGVEGDAEKLEALKAHGRWRCAELSILD